MSKLERLIDDDMKKTKDTTELRIRELYYNKKSWIFWVPGFTVKIHALVHPELKPPGITVLIIHNLACPKFKRRGLLKSTEHRVLS